jgi:hypothetical protein
MRNLITCIFSILISITAFAQEQLGNGLVIDKMIHDFGDILLESGPVSCTFTIQNKGEKAAVIYNVASSCGCTDVKWTREPLRPGGKGTISVTYSNDEGAYPFDKNLTVYISDIKKPVILKVRGISHEKKKPLEELYPVRFGSFGIKETYIKCGNIEQKGMRSDAVNVANLSNQPLKVEFADISPYLSISVSPNPIPARGVAEMEFTVRASREKWGKNDYFATPVLNGKRYTCTNGKENIGIWAFTKENFSHLTQEQKNNGPIPMFNESTFSFGKVKQGTIVHATYKMKNEGKEPFKVYKVDINACKWSHSTFPVVAPGNETEFRVHLDTADMPKGESLTIVTLITNSPLRPIVNLFIAGWLE